MKLTGWYDGCQKPVRAGLYRRWAYPADLPPMVVWSYWTGEFWGVGSVDKKRALEYAHFRSSAQCKPWRGIKGPEF